MTSVASQSVDNNHSIQQSDHVSGIHDKSLIGKKKLKLGDQFPHFCHVNLTIRVQKAHQRSIT